VLKRLVLSAFSLYVFSKVPMAPGRGLLIGVPACSGSGGMVCPSGVSVRCRLILAGLIVVCSSLVSSPAQAVAASLLPAVSARCFLIFCRSNRWVLRVLASVLRHF